MGRILRMWLGVLADGQDSARACARAELFAFGPLPESDRHLGGTCEKVVTLVIYHNECREVLDLNSPHGLHTQFGIFEWFDLRNAILSELRSRASD